MTSRKNLELFLTEMIKGYPDEAYKYCSATWRHKHSLSELISLFPKDIKDYETMEERYTNNVIKDITVKINGNIVVARMLRESGPYVTSEKGNWGLNPISIAGYHSK